MWRRIYLVLVLWRLYGALCPSYIHPDEHFQGPEVIAGEILGFPIYQTWEFTSVHPVRSIFPLWVVYGTPLTLLKWIREGMGYGPVAPMTAFYGLRIVMFLLSFVLGDWAIHELLARPHDDRRVAIILVSSSFVTATFQTHTFSNSIETLLVLWTHVLSSRLYEHPQRIAARSCLVLAFILVLGVFNRITFPAFVILPLLQLLPSFFTQPLRIPILASAGIFTLLVAIAMDTEYYTHAPLRLRNLATTAVLTPWNNLRYNTDVSNLAQHGLHPFWQHTVANLPQLLGPAMPLLFSSLRHKSSLLLFSSATIGTLILSAFPHQEPRFLLPAVPLFLSSIRLPRFRPGLWISAWLIFNLAAGALFGIYHQGGVVPVQAWLAANLVPPSSTSLSTPSLLSSSPSSAPPQIHVTWWKTYSPPRWLLGSANTFTTTTDLMGADITTTLLPHLRAHAMCPGDEGLGALLVAPVSAVGKNLKGLLTDGGAEKGRAASEGLRLREVWRHSAHVGLDDLDWGEDGVWGTLKKVVGERGLGVWRVEGKC